MTLLPRRDRHESSSINRRTGQSADALGADGFDRFIEHEGAHGADGSDSPGGRSTASRARGNLEGVLDDPDRTSEFDPPECLASISRGNARYLRGDAECEADYRVAFLLDAGLAAREIVRRLEDDIQADFATVLVSCRKRLVTNPRDVVARTRLGLTLLMLRQEDDGFRALQQVFLDSPVWRPFLRLLVNEARPKSATLIARLLRSL
jgi:hypothetical protein